MRNTELADLAHEIHAYIHISAKLMTRDMDERLSQHSPGLSGPQFAVLRIVACQPTTIKELSDRMLLAPSTLVPIIDRLEGDGLLVRGKDPDDRRRTPLELTEKARLHLEQVPAFDGHDALSQALQHMNAEDSHKLSQLLQQLVSELAHDPALIQHVLSFSPRAMKSRAAPPR